MFVQHCYRLLIYWLLIIDLLIIDLFSGTGEEESQQNCANLRLAVEPPLDYGEYDSYCTATFSQVFPLLL